MDDQNSKPGAATKDSQYFRELGRRGGLAPHSKPVGFAAMDPERAREISSAGGSHPNRNSLVYVLHIWHWDSTKLVSREPFTYEIGGFQYYVEPVKGYGNALRRAFEIKALPRPKAYRMIVIRKPDGSGRLVE